MSDTPRTDARLGWGWNNYFSSAGKLCRELERELNQAIKERDDWMLKAAKAIRQHDEALKDVESNKAGWDRASLTALNLEQRLKRAEKCIDAIEAHYKSKHGESYDHTTLNTIITNWRDNANTLQN